jgi:hypothetical protein
VTPRVARRPPVSPGASFAILLASLASACGDPSPTETRELSGYVRDERTERPVRSATVTFRSDTLYTSSAVTDRDGLYEMVVETDTDFGQVRVEAVGYFPAERTVFFDSRRRRVDFLLRPQ